MVKCTLWLDFGLPFETKHSHCIFVSEESFDRFINEISEEYKINKEEEFDEDLGEKCIRYYASKNSLLSAYLGSKFIKKNGGEEN